MRITFNTKAKAKAAQPAQPAAPVYATEWEEREATITRLLGEFHAASERVNKANESGDASGVAQASAERFKLLEELQSEARALSAIIPACLAELEAKAKTFEDARARLKAESAELLDTIGALKARRSAVNDQFLAATHRYNSAAGDVQRLERLQEWAKRQLPDAPAARAN